jgi:hypothetical protein
VAGFVGIRTVSTTCLGESGSSELFWNTSTAGY